MKKTLFGAILLAGCISTAHAQEITTNAVKELRYEHYFSVQLNDLLRQIISFNNSTAAANNNPFLFTYNINSRKSGWGLRAGVGATISSSTTNDNVTKRTSDINDYQLRVGVEKKFSLSEKWSTGVGLDAILKTNDDKTVAVTNNVYTFTVNTESNTTSYGGGAMAWLRYNLTPRVLIGTETSFYYTSGKTKSTVVTSDNSPNNNYSETKTDDTNKNGQISVPVTFYITVKF